MTRRRLLISTYSDDDDDQENQPPPPQQQQKEHDNDIYSHQQPAVHYPPQNPNPSLPEPIHISDEEFIDVSDDLIPPLPPPEPVSNHSMRQPPPQNPMSYGCSIGDFLSGMGLKLKTEWLDSCLQGLEGSVQGLDVAGQAKLCLQQFLFSDMNHCGSGVLPPNVDSMHLVDLAGPFVLQVDEIVNISCPLKGRYQESPPGIKRCLKLSMTDGVQRVFGLEYRPIKDLQVLSPAGLKVVICNVHIRRGLLMLVPEAIEVLGGMADELEAARQRLVAEVNKPPRGKRSRTGLLPPLATRATLAAWPPNGNNTPGSAISSGNVQVHTNNSASIFSRSDGSVSVHGHTSASVNAHGHTGASVNAHGHTGASVNAHGHTGASVNAHGHTGASVNAHGHTSASVNAHGRTNYSNVTGSTNSSTLRGPASFPIDDQGSDVATRGLQTNQSSPEEFSVQMNSGSSIPSASSNVFSDVEEMHIDTLVGRENDVLDRNSNLVSNHEDVHMIDEIEHPLILSGDREIPFTYLASLSVKWASVKEKAPSVRGKIKCFLTGVKGFKYRHTTTYELQVYVDDGSLISELLIDHNVVQRGIGHSPEEVTGALSSSDAKRVSDMKGRMQQFQIFLVNFEGTMLVEINRSSPIPVALEMIQGCSASDAWLLLRRLNSSAPPQTPQGHFPDPIDLSP